MKEKVATRVVVGYAVRDGDKLEWHIDRNRLLAGLTAEAFQWYFRCISSGCKDCYECNNYRDVVKALAKVLADDYKPWLQHSTNAKVLYCNEVEGDKVKCYDEDGWGHTVEIVSGDKYIEKDGIVETVEKTFETIYNTLFKTLREVLEDKIRKEFEHELENAKQRVKELEEKLKELEEENQRLREELERWQEVARRLDEIVAMLPTSTESSEYDDP